MDRVKEYHTQLKTKEGEFRVCKTKLKIEIRKRDVFLFTCSYLMAA